MSDDQYKGTVISDGGSYATNADLIPTGAIIDGRYKIIEKIGSGSFGCVYKVYDNLRQKEKALKIIYSLFSAQEDVMFRLRKEIDRMDAFDDKTHIVKSYDLHQGELFNYIDMELLSGGSLRKLIDSSPNEKLSEKEAIDIAKQIITGMITVHNKGIIHKDLKPDNILLTDNKQIKISDFGISEKMRTSRSRLDETKKEGTREYMSPEQLIGKKVGKEADVWSFGVILYEMLSGEICFRGETTSEMMFSIERILDVEKNKETREFVQYGKIEPIPDVSDKINLLIKKCLNYNYTERFRNFEEIQNFLNQDSDVGKKKKRVEKENNKKRKDRGKQKLKQIQRNKIQKNKQENFKKHKEEKKAETQRKKTKQIFGKKKKFPLIPVFFIGLLSVTTFFIVQFVVQSNNMKPLEHNMKPLEHNMVFVKGGTFQMGSNNGDADEKPVHSVTVDDFYIGSYEVTQKEWQDVMGNNPSKFKGYNLPVEQVSWYDAVEFCNKLSEKEGLTPCYTGSGKNIKCNFSANGYRLPTEAEWEFAARGGNKSKGYKYSGSNNIIKVAWYWRNSGDNNLSGEWKSDKIVSNNCSTHTVGSKQPNELGLYDMSGNVEEWCNDWNGSYSSASQINPTGANSGSLRVFRGGSWYDDAEYCRVAFRGGHDPGRGYGDLGFRLARTP